jgi:hypothetical protein
MNLTKIGSKHQAIPKDQAWFHLSKWQVKESEADEAIARGEVSGPFASAEAAVRHLRKRRKQQKG